MLGTSASRSACMISSFSHVFLARLVEPKADILSIQTLLLFFKALKNSISLGFEPGQPPSIQSIPNSIKRSAILSLSITVKFTSSD